MKKNLLFIICWASISFKFSAHGAEITNQITHWQNDGKIVVSIPVKLDKLDPILSLNAHSKFTLPLIFEPLVTINSQQELHPALAKSWQISDDNKSITLYLNHNHHFSDNTEVTAKDVVRSIYRLCSNGSQEYGQARGLIGCREYAQKKSTKPHVFAVDKYTLKFNISSSPSTFLYQLSAPSTVIAKNTGGNLIGSGPYKIQQANNQFTILTKNPYYLGDTIVKNNGVVFFYADGHHISSFTEHAKPDGALLYEMTALDHFHNKAYTLIKTNPNITNILVFNNQRFPFNQPEIRKTLAAELYNNLDYTCIAGAHKAYGIIPYGIGGSLTNTMPDSIPAITPKTIFAHFPQLKKNKFPVVIHQLHDLQNCESEQIISLFKKFNIDVHFEYHKDYTELLPRYINHNLDAFIDLYIFKNREAYNIFSFFAKNGENDANIMQNAVDNMLLNALNTPTSHGRFLIYRKLTQYMQDNAIVVPLFYMDHGNLMSQCLTGISKNFIFNPFSELPNISRTNACKT